MNNIRRVLIKFFYLGFFGFIFTLNIREIMDPDFFWHLRTGQYILTNIAIPHTNIFSFTYPGIEWLNHEWLSQVLLYAIYNVGGFISLIYMKAALLTLTFIIFFTTLLKISKSRIVSFFFTALAVRISMPYFTMRPQIFSYFLLAALMYILYAYITDVSRKKMLKIIPLLMLLWVNLHGVYIIGMATLAVFAFCEIFETFKITQRANNVLAALKQSPLFKIFAISCVLLLINPYTWKSLIYPVTYLFGQGRLHTHYITEWQSVNFHEGYALFVVFYCLIVYLSFAFSKSKTARELIVILIFSYLGISANRNLPLMVLVVTPAAVFAGKYFFNLYAQRFQLWNIKHKFRFLCLHIILIFIPLVFGYSFFYMNERMLGNNPIDTLRFPQDSVEYLKNNDYSEKRILNLYKWGGYFIWHLYPQYKNFIDGRGIMFPADFLVEYFNFAKLKIDWKVFLEKHKIDMILWDKNSPVSTILTESNNWKIIFEGRSSCIYAKSSVKTPDTVRIRE
ncbi:hypothetical protein KJ633_01460 [bacterium]|nr:hypothetical protein [bacterium]MBU3955106.1 hypothetical protein [bacterium]